MNYKIKNDSLIAECELCGELELGDLILKDEKVHCVYCANEYDQLGFEWDLPEWCINKLRGMDENDKRSDKS